MDYAYSSSVVHRMLNVTVTTMASARWHVHFPMLLLLLLLIVLFLPISSTQGHSEDQQNLNAQEDEGYHLMQDPDLG